MLLCITPALSPSLALLLGQMLSVTIGDPFAEFNYKATGRLLKGGGKVKNPWFISLFILALAGLSWRRNTV